MTYDEQVLVIAHLLTARRELERGGKPKAGWMQAHDAPMAELREASARFPGMDFDLMCDAYETSSRHGR